MNGGAASQACTLCGGKEPRLFRTGTSSICAFCIRRTAELILRGAAPAVRSIWGRFNLSAARGDVVPRRTKVVDERTKEWLDQKGTEPYSPGDVHAVNPELFSATAGFHLAMGSRAEALGAAARALLEGSLGDAMAKHRDAALAVVFGEVDDKKLHRLAEAIGESRSLRRKRG